MYHVWIKQVHSDYWVVTVSTRLHPTQVGRAKGTTRGEAMRLALSNFILANPTCTS